MNINNLNTNYHFKHYSQSFCICADISHYSGIIISVSITFMLRSNDNNQLQYLFRHLHKGALFARTGKIKNRKKKKINIMKRVKGFGLFKY